MKKLSLGFAMAAVFMLSSQSFAAITIRILSCETPKTSNGQPVVGVGYKLQIKAGFDTHTINANGTIGAPIAPSFQLLSKVVYPSAPTLSQELTLESRGSDGSYNLAGNGMSANVNNSMSKAVIAFSSNAATAFCD